MGSKPNLEFSQAFNAAPSRLVSVDSLSAMGYTGQMSYVDSVALDQHAHWQFDLRVTIKNGYCQNCQ